MSAAEPILTERARLAPGRVHRLAAPSLTAAHHGLGKLVATAARAAARTRMARLGRDVLADQIAASRSCRDLLLERSKRRTVAPALRRGIQDYFDCLSAWAHGAGLGALVDLCPRVAARPVTADELALWLQDDNTGCQTGTLRRPDGSVLFWHTEEDTIGYFDRPRIVSLGVGAAAHRFFIYPYLLPGPAFGWNARRVQAVDSLNLDRSRHPGGAVSNAATWLAWRLGDALTPAEIVEPLFPFVDGCAINVIETARGRVTAGTCEFGADRLLVRRLPVTQGSFDAQVNCVSRTDVPLARYEALTPRERRPYENRIRRTHSALARLSARAAVVSPQDILEMLASKEGGSYAYANLDVKAHCVGVASQAGIELYVGAGAAARADRYAPQWRLP